MPEEEKVDFDRLNKKYMITRFASRTLIAYIYDKEFKEQVDRIVQKHPVLKMDAQTFDAKDLLLSVALGRIADEFIDNYEAFEAGLTEGSEDDAE